MRCRFSFIAVLLLAVAAGAADSAPAETPPPKHRLGGGFKGQAVTPTAASPQTPHAKERASTEEPPGRHDESGKPPPRIMIDNALVKKGAPADRKPAPAKASAGNPAPPQPPVEMPKIVDLQGHDEVYWRAKAAATREAVAKAKDLVAASEAEEKREENDFYAWDDGQYRDNVIKPAWDRAREETIKARQSLDEAQKQLDQLDDDARKAGAYPGWIRE